MKNLKLVINKLVLISKRKKTKSAIFIGNTKKQSKNSYYYSGIRKHINFSYVSIIVYSNNITKKIIKLIDGKIDIIFYDLEKKIKSSNKNSIVNIERAVKENTKITKTYPYKANDITVSSAETLISNFYKNDIRGIGGKQSLILGAGNIGFKLGLKLNESGSNIYLYRRDKRKLKKLVYALNTIKPSGTIAKSYVCKNLKKELVKSDIIINCSNKKNILGNNHLDLLKNDVCIIDIGKGMFNKASLKKLIKKNINVFRLDVTPGYNSFIENYSISNKLYNFNKFGRNRINGKTYISRGILGYENEIVVDNPYNPKIIYGIADGYGDFKR